MFQLSFPWTGYDQYNLKIGKLNFKIKKFGMLAFKNDEPYAIYYTPRTKILLSAEWLRETAVNDLAGGIGGEA